jgi:NAD+ kinase
MSKSPTIGIAVKPGVSRALEAGLRLLAWVRERSFPYIVDATVASSLKDVVAAELFVAREDLTTKADIVVVLGGDGTLISVCRSSLDNPATVIGVNVGTLGFLTEVTVDEMLGVLEAVVEGNAEIESRALLSAHVRLPSGKDACCYNAINDIVLSKEALARIFALEVLVDGRLAAVLRGDGVIASTPAGSTAYSLSAGGSIVHPRVDALLLTPICPHSLSSRPLILPGDARVTLRIPQDSAGHNGDIFLTVDGQEGMEVAAGVEIDVVTSPHRVNIATSPSRSYFEVLGTKLNWPNK